MSQTDPTTTDSDLADQLVQDLRTTYGPIWLYMPRVVAFIERLRQLEKVEDRALNLAHRLDQALADKAAAEVEHDPDIVQWAKRIRELEEQVRALTVERDHLHEIYDAANADRESYAGQIDQLREQVERLTEELKETNAQK